MKRILTSVGLGIGVVALSAGSAIACPPTPTDPDPKYPQSKGWYFVNDTVTFPRGYACNVAIKFHVVGHQRTLVNGHLPPKDWKGPQPGDRVKNVSPDEIVTLTNLKNHRSVTKLISGTLYDHVQRNGTTIKTRGVGKNLFNGKGVQGIVYASGKQRLTVTHFGTPRQTLHIDRTKGTTIEMCHVLGATAVPGKNLEPNSNHG
jgi:hypothetical protein